MSSIWTPSGERPVGPTGADVGPEAPGRAATVESAGPGASGEPGEVGEPDEAAVREELRRVRSELANTPVADLIANHAIGLWQLAVLHLTPDEEEPPSLDEAGLAIDAMAALVETLGDRLGESTEPLRDALAQLRMAFVQMSQRAGESPAESPAESRADDTD